MSGTWSGTAYCVRCKEKRDLVNAPITLSVSEKTGRETRLAKGTCGVCGTKLSRILGKAEATA